MLPLKTLLDNRSAERFEHFNAWVMEFFRREVLREASALDLYSPSARFGPAMRPEVSYWNPNRSKHAEVYWLENFVFNQRTSMRNKILNAMAVKFVGMPTLTLVATDSADYTNIIDFDEYDQKGKYFEKMNNNLDTNRHKLPVWGRTQLQTSLQTAARNFCRLEDGADAPFKLSKMLRWISHLDQLGLSKQVMDPKNKLGDVCNWLRTHHGIGPYFAYHPPCNFSRCNDLPHIDEDDDYCLVGPGAKRGLEYVFPNVRFSEKSASDYIIAVKHHQKEFFDFGGEDREFFIANLERGGRLTTFGAEITFCQFACFLAIKDDPRAQEKRMLPLTFDSFIDIANKVRTA